MVQTPHFRIIYPEHFEKKAQEMIPMLDYLSIRGNKTLNYIPKRVPLILHNYNISANAFTVWAPKRVELYTCPPQDSYAQSWLDQLLIHEYRHVVQIDRTNQGFTKVLSWLTGEQAATMINGAFVPSWFMEGDAVCTETALSQSGRGRIPSFEMLLRAQVTQKGAFSYDKAALGSYKTFVPNQYSLGYTLVANVRRKYGYHAWIGALDEVARKPFIITPFNHGLKKATGSGKEQLYRMTMSDMDSMWKYQDVKTTKTKYNELTIINKKQYENYKYPYYLNDTLVVSEYSSLDDITRFVISGPNGYTKIITTPGFLSSDIFSLTKAKETCLHPNIPNVGDFKNNILLAWTETIEDPRWKQRNYSEIRMYDGNTTKTTTLTRKSRYFAPAFSPDGKSIIAGSDTSLFEFSILTKAGYTTGTTDGEILSIDISTDGRKVVTGTRNGKTILWDRANGYNKEVLLEENKNQIYAVAFNNYGNLLASGNLQGALKIWDLRDKRLIYNLRGHSARITDIKFSPDGKFIAVAGFDNICTLWDASNLNIQPIKLKGNSWMLSVAFSNFGDKLVTGASRENRLVLWPTKTSEMASLIYKKLSRNLTQDEWQLYVGADIAYEKTK